MTPEREAAVVVLLERIAMALEKQPAAVAASAGRPAAPAGTGAFFPNYGRSKGAPIAGASMAELDYYAGNARKSIADPAKEKWRDKETALLTAIDAERKRQDPGCHVAPMPGSTEADFGPPPPSANTSAEAENEDIPF